MHANFGIERERYNKLFFKSYENDKGALHFHSQIELYFIDDGQMEAFIGDQKRLLSKGEMSVALSYTPHAYATPHRSRSSVLIIPLYLCTEFTELMQRRRVTNPFICDADAVARIRECYRQIIDPNANALRRRGYIYVILGLILDHICTEATTTEMDPDLSSRILFYINEHFRGKLSLTVLSTALGYSPGHISRYFKDCFHIGVNQYISFIRLKNAVQLMLEKKNSITYCALESGFPSMRTFYRVFFEEFHCSPKEYLSQLAE